MTHRLRKARSSDIDLTYGWVNDPVIRRHSFSAEAVAFEDHKNWFTNQLNSADTAYYILERQDDTPLGSIRFDMKGTTAKINYLVDPAFHGMGLGKIILQEGLVALNADFPAVESVYGWVFAENIASIKIFEKLDFVLTEKKDNLLKFEQKHASHEN